MGQLKQFIKENRDGFDTENPDPRLLQRLQKQLHPEKNKKSFWLTVLPWAAVLAGTFVVSAVIYMNTSKNTQSPPVVIKQSSESNKDGTEMLYPLYTRQIGQFEELIGVQQTELRTIGQTQPELYHRFSADINQLDSAFQVLKKTMAQNPNKELLLEEMIRNLQLQTELLDHQLLIIKELKQKKNSHEKVTI